MRRSPVDYPTNPIVVRDCADEIWPDTWALDLGTETIAYVQGEDLAGTLAFMFNPENDAVGVLDVLAYLMQAGLQLAKDHEALYQKVKRMCPECLE
jgi:hypothetical protein